MNATDHEQTNRLECSQCGVEIPSADSRCPECGSLNTKIDAILAWEEEELQRRTLKGRFQAIFAAKNKKSELLHQVNAIRASLTKQSYWTLLFIIAFVFALVITVM
jgi:predicted ATP-dependent serine protease